VRFAVNVPNFGDFADARPFADLARRAEEAGWDGLFVWDHIVHQKNAHRETGDPWLLLTAAAVATSRIRLGTMITPVARRRVQKLAKEVTTLDRLSGGRVIFGAGLGAPIDDEFGSFGEPTEPRELAVRLDEGLTALGMLWSGRPVNYHGEHVVVDDVTFLPTPVQRPRVPVWIAGYWPARAPMRRAARWDGAVPIIDPAKNGGREALPPPASAVREVRDFIASCRGPEPFDLSIAAASPADRAAARDVTAELAEAGVTWWQEALPRDQGYDRLAAVLRRVDAGPPL
jgi:alkanesulfonate monooxygenase SsuD/methylene tetrahydromethanopterin reductase-like flavin-dependent oxidoreductase (luciferase family)